MISEMFFPSHTGLNPDHAKLLKGVADEMMAFELKKDIGNYALSKFDDDKRLGTEAKRLDILVKKKQLGLPIDDDEYEDLINQDSHSELTNALSSLTIKKTHPKVARGEYRDWVPFWDTPKDFKRAGEKLPLSSFELVIGSAGKKAGPSAIDMVNTGSAASGKSKRLGTILKFFK